MSALDEFASLVAMLYEAAADPPEFGRFLYSFYEKQARSATMIPVRCLEGKP